MINMLTPYQDAKLEQEVKRLPEHCRGGFLRYLRYGIEPGGFLLAVLANNLREAVGRADETNKRALADYVFVLYNYAPSAAWGSPERVEAWITKAQTIAASNAADAGRD